MKIKEYIRKRIFETRLDQRGMLVVYDPDGKYKPLVDAVGKGKDVIYLDASVSSLDTRKQAYQFLANATNNEKLLIYVPVKKSEGDDRMADPFTLFAQIGGVFPDNVAADSLRSMSLEANPKNADELKALFEKEANPSFEMIDNTGTQVQWAALRTVFSKLGAGAHAASPLEIILTLLEHPWEIPHYRDNGLFWDELASFLDRYLGLDLNTMQEMPDFKNRLWQQLLFSDFAYDLPDALPSSLQGVALAPEEHKAIVSNVCNQLRDSNKFAKTYAEQAERIERALNLEASCADLSDLGATDTFAFENRFYLKQVVNTLQKGDINTAKAIADVRWEAYWSNSDDRQKALWQLVSLVIELFTSLQQAEKPLKQTNSLAGLVADYTQSYSQIDRLYRRFESVVSDFIDDEATMLAELVQQRYRSWTDQLQAVLMKQVDHDGWNPGLPSTRTLFDKTIAPILQQSGRRVAYMMVDAMRYELGQMLNELLQRYQGELTAYASAMPSITPVGMAALLPDATNQLLTVTDGKLQVTYKGKAVMVPTDREQILKDRYGDRFARIAFEDAFKKKQLPKTADLLVITHTAIDSLLESNTTSLQMVDKYIRQLEMLTEKLVQQGFTDIFFATDHGFFLFNGDRAGYVCEKPIGGEWNNIHERLLVGKGKPNHDGLLGCSTQDLLMPMDNPMDVCLPDSTACFMQNMKYFHGGMSLQECVVPVLHIRSNVASAGTGTSLTVELKPKRTTIQNRIFRVDLAVLGDMFDSDQSATVRIEIVDDLKKRNAVGILSKSDTGMMEIQSGGIYPLSLRLTDDAPEVGEIHILCVDSQTKVQLPGGHLVLKTDLMV